MPTPRTVTETLINRTIHTGPDAAFYTINGDAVVLNRLQASFTYCIVETCIYFKIF